MLPERQRISGSDSGVDTAAAQASASLSLLWGIGAELAVAGAGDGLGRLEADGGQQGFPAKAGARRCRRHAAGSALKVVGVAGAHLRGVCAPVQLVRRAGAPGWVHHRAGEGGADTGTCRRANNCTANRTGALTTASAEWTAPGCSGVGV